MPTVNADYNTQYTNPESGWTRHDLAQGDGVATWEGSWSHYTDSTYWNNTGERGNSAGVNGSKFNFTGTKLRVMGRTYPSYGSGLIYIDGTPYLIRANADDAWINCMFSIEGLSDGEHSAFILQTEAGSFDLDCIDVDDGKEYKAYNVLINFTKVTNYADLDIGKYIECEFISSSKTFENLGNASKALLPAEPAAACNGKFNFICVKKTSEGAICVADRILYATQTWTSLNLENMVEGIPYSTYGLIRMLTGGICYKDANGKQLYADTNAVGVWPENNEWDRFIKDNDFGGLHGANDAGLWNHYMWFTWCADTVHSAVDNYDFKACRRAYSMWNRYNEDTSGVDRGYRPVLEVRFSGSYWGV